MKKRIVIIGGGAAGFFCAVNLPGNNSNLEVVLLEKSSKLLSKVRISGGGRCNVTHACFEIGSLVKKYPRGSHFLKKAFHIFNPQQCISWFSERGVALKKEADGRMFPETNDSATIVECLLREAGKKNVQVMLNREVKAVRLIKRNPDNEEAIFEISLVNSEIVLADFMVVACGGFSKLSMFNWLTSLGHTIQAPVPSLFTFNIPGNVITTLMGISVEKVKVKIVGTKLADEGSILITHWGLSGPAILKLSAWGARELANQQYHFTIMVNWLPHFNEETLRTDWPIIRKQLASQKMSNKNPFALPARLWTLILSESGLKEDTRWADLPSKEQNKLIKNLTAQEFIVKGKTTFKEEFVTCGGIQLSEIDPQTMESKMIPNLYFAGEIMDVDGITGGFNFQHAWTSGWIASKSITGKLESAITR